MLNYVMFQLSSIAYIIHFRSCYYNCCRICCHTSRFVHPL